MIGRRGHGADGGRESGFTLLELMVAMGLLASFLVLLVQLLNSSASVFQRGERGQEEADRLLAAARAVRAALTPLAGPRAEVPPGDGDVDARLMLYEIDTATVIAGRDPEAPRPPRVPLLRSTVAIGPAIEDRLLAEALRPMAEEQVGRADPAVLEIRLAELVRTWPRSGRGELLMTAWPADPAGEYLDLRVGLRLADPQLLSEGELPLAAFELPEDLSVDDGEIRRTTRPVAVGLLHFGVVCESQRAGGLDDGGLTLWDSARAGLLIDPQNPDQGFAFDLGPDSLRDPRDDLWPRWIRVTVTVGRGPDAVPEAFLTRPLDADDRELVVAGTDDLPSADESRWVKVGNEWVRYSEQRGNRLIGLRRGERGTVAREHPSGTPVRAGREAVLWIRLPHGRDSDV